MDDYAIRRYQPVSIADESGGSIETPPQDRTDYTVIWCDPISHSEGVTTLVVDGEVEVEIGDFLRIPHDAFLRS